MTKSAEISVELIDCMGSDISVVNAARVSFHKESSFDEADWDEETGHEIEYVGSNQLRFDDQKLIGYLAKHDHWSPFAHAFMSFRIKAPIFLARQLGKHQVGLAWNEVSRRYVSDEPEFYMPDGWRGKPPGSIKQGSSDTIIPFGGSWVTGQCRDLYQDDTEHKLVLMNHAKICQAALHVYTEMIDNGIAPEMARMVLPQSMMTEWIWSGSVMAFARICKLRLDPHAQLENLQVAQPIAAAAEEHFPYSWKALLNDAVLS